jgi:hypothetical protein
VSCVTAACSASHMCWVSLLSHCPIGSLPWY